MLNRLQKLLLSRFKGARSSVSSQAGLIAAAAAPSLAAKSVPGGERRIDEATFYQSKATPSSSASPSPILPSLELNSDPFSQLFLTLMASPKPSRRDFMRLSAMAAPLMASTVSRAQVRSTGKTVDAGLSDAAKALLDDNQATREAALAALLPRVQGNSPLALSLTRFLLREEGVVMQRTQRPSAIISDHFSALLAKVPSQISALWSLFTSSGEPAIQNQALPPLGGVERRIPYSADDLRLLVQAMVEAEPPTPGAWEVAASLSARLFPSQAEIALPPGYDIWRSALYHGVITAEALDDQGAQRRLQTVYKSMVPAPHLAAWLPSAPRSVQKTLMDAMDPAPRPFPKDREAFLQSLLFLLNDSELRSAATRCLIGMDFGYNEVEPKAKALATLAQAAVLSANEDHPDRAAIQGMSEALNQMSSAWGMPALQPAFMSLNPPATGVLTSIMAASGNVLGPVNEAFVVKLLKDVQMGFEPLAARTLLSRLPADTALSSDVAKQVSAALAGGLGTSAATGNQAASTGLAPDPKAVTAGVLAQSQSQWTSLNVNNTGSPNDPSSLSSLAYASVGQALQLSPAMVDVLVGELGQMADPQQRAAAIQVLMSGSLANAPISLQAQILQSLLPILNLSSVAPNIDEVERRVDEAVAALQAQGAAGDAKVLLYSGNQLDLYAKAYLLYAMTPAERAQIKTGLSPIATLASTIGLAEATYIQLAANVPPVTGEGTPADVWNRVVGPRLNVGSAATLQSAPSVLSALLASLATPAVLGQVLINNTDDPKVKSQVFQLMNQGYDVQESAQVHPFLLKETVKSSMAPQSKDEAAAAAAVMGRLLRGQLSPLAVAETLKQYPSSFNREDVGGWLGGVISNVNSSLARQMVYSKVLERDVKWARVPLDVRGIRNLKDFFISPGLRPYLPELCKRIEPLRTDSEAPYELAQLIAGDLRLSIKTGDTEHAAACRQAVAALSGIPAFSQALESLKSDPMDEDLRLALA